MKAKIYATTCVIRTRKCRVSKASINIILFSIEGKHPHTMKISTGHIFQTEGKIFSFSDLKSKLV